MNKKRILSLDFETFSPVPIADVGLYRYINDPGFEPLLLSYAYDDEDPVCIDFTAGDEIPGEVVQSVLDREDSLSAYNCAFEREVLRRMGYQSEPEAWTDTMILAAYCGLPLSLGMAGAALGLSEDKAKLADGKQLIRLFCTPRKPTKKNPSTRVMPSDEPEKWERFKEYNRQDVVAEREIRNRLSRWAPDETEHKFWCLDQRINAKGMRIDRQLAENAVLIGDAEREILINKAIMLTDISNPNSTSQVKDWLREQEGIEVASLNKKAISDVVGQLQTDKAKQLLELRSKLAKASVKKYDGMLRCAMDDDHIRGMFQFYGARTGRFAGRLVQPQNFPQNHMSDLAEARELVRLGDLDSVRLLYESPQDTLSELLRTALIPEEGCQFVVADYSAIEARVTAWFAQEEWRLNVFRDGGDIYCASASQMFHVPVVKNGENGHLRQKGKVAELALGYGGGVGALKAFGADKMGMSEEEMGETVAKWREASPNICAMWRGLERAAVRCTVTHKEVVEPRTGTAFRFDHGIMWMRLPTGREVPFYDPRYEESARGGFGKSLSYMGVNQKTRKWERIETFGGRLTENLVQATARDCLRESMLLLDAEGWDIRATVHDEVICSEPLLGRTSKDMCEVMGRPLSWAPGLPLKGAGYECPFYMKD